MAKASWFPFYAIWHLDSLNENVSTDNKQTDKQAYILNEKYKFLMGQKDKMCMWGVQ